MHIQQSVLPLLAFIGSLLIGCERGEPRPAPQASASIDTTVADISKPDTGAASSSALPSNVVGVTWQWISFTTPVEQIKVENPDRYTIRFEVYGRAALRADCNRGTTSYSVNPDRRIAFRPIALTRAMCPPGSLSDRFAKEVGRATSYFMKDGDLFLELPVDTGTLRFRLQT